MIFYEFRSKSMETHVYKCGLGKFDLGVCNHKFRYIYLGKTNYFIPFYQNDRKFGTPKLSLGLNLDS
ncbi:hypothetical protein HanIR_Chr15g0736401 [Helianthus annuus]|nr:hypothetical protein HanIR_Chr15g0736401 [Helianthus annuus]